jgi:hypothetical protein
VDDNVVAQMRALGSVLQSTSTLKFLTLSAHKFNNVSMGHLGAGLRANTTLTKLVLEECRFDSAATTAFVDCMQSKLENVQPTLSELHVSDLTMFEGTTIEEFIVSIFAWQPTPGNNSNLHRTIGSSVQSFTTSGSSFPCVMNVLAQHARTVRLSAVHFATPPPIDKELELVCISLPTLVYVKELTVQYESHAWANRRDEDKVVDALRSNGSLVRMSLSRGEYVYTDASYKRLKNYFERNKSMPALLANGDKSFDTQPGRSLFPSLFQVAKSMPAMSANMILIGLLTASSNDAIGPSAGTKRTVPSVCS